MKVALYARVSKPDQNPEYQLAELRKFAESRKLVIVEEFVDHGVSGALERRPQLDRLLDQARKHKFEGVLVWKFDRWARSVRHLVQTLEEFRIRGIRFFSFTENVDTETPMGQAMFHIMASMAQLERDLNSERTSASLRVAQEAGIVLGQPRLNKEEDVRRLYLIEGLSMRKIATQLKVSVGYVHGAISVAPTSGAVGGKST